MINSLKNETVSDHSSDLSLHARGGLGGQLLALAYGFWAPRNIDRNIRLYFHDGGTSYRPPVLEKLYGTQTVLASNMSFEHIFEYEKQISKKENRSSSKIFRVLKDSMSKLVQDSKSNVPLDYDDVTIEKLKSLPKDVFELSGYTIDYRIFEESIPEISASLIEANLPNFFVGAGTQPTVSIHWRLGDYLGNEFHGVIPITSIIEALSKVNVAKDTQVTIYTDSPDYAYSQLEEHNLHQAISIKSSDIWTDLYNMSRSNIFIGNHSSISMIAALAIANSSGNSQIFFPDKWFVDEKNSNRFYAPSSYSTFKTYDSGF